MNPKVTFLAGVFVGSVVTGFLIEKANQEETLQQQIDDALTVLGRARVVDTGDALEVVNQPARNSKPVRCVQTGEEFPSIKECGQRMGINAISISHQLHGRQASAGGHTFEFITKE